MKLKFKSVVIFLSTLACAGTMYWWIHSSNRMDTLTLQFSEKQTFNVWGHDGKMAVMRTAAPNRAEDETKPHGHLTWGSVPYDAAAMGSTSPQLMWTSFTFGSHARPNEGVTESTAVLPMWALTATFGLLPAWWVISKFKSKKKQQQH